MKEMQF
nr:unnamed protein product [Callosobruchus analis]